MTQDATIIGSEESTSFIELNLRGEFEDVCDELKRTLEELRDEKAKLETMENELEKLQASNSENPLPTEQSATEKRLRISIQHVASMICYDNKNLTRQVEQLLLCLASAGELGIGLSISKAKTK